MYGSPSICYDGDEHVNLSSSSFRCLYMRVVFSVVFGLDDDRDFVTAISKFLLIG